MNSNLFKQSASSRFSSLADEVKTTTTITNKDEKPKGGKVRAKDAGGTKASIFQEKTPSRFDFKEELDEMKKSKNVDEMFQGGNNNTNNNKNRGIIGGGGLYDEKETNTFNRLTFRERIQKEIEHRERTEREERERRKKEIEDSLTDASSFPELVAVNKQQQQPQQQQQQQPQQQQPIVSAPAPASDYADKLKWVAEEVVVEDEWKGLSLIEKEGGRKTSESKLRASAPPADILKKLVDLYNIWKTDYINKWGYDDYDRTFRFPNYDYEYFDKLDEIYEYEQFKLMEKEMEKEREAEIEYYDNSYDRRQYDD